MMKWIVAGTLAATCTCANAADLVLIDVMTNDQSRQVYALDEASIEKVGSLYQAMIHGAAAIKDSSRAGGSSTVEQLVQFDCERPRSRTLKTEYRYVDGRAADKRPRGPWSELVPNSNRAKAAALVGKRMTAEEGTVFRNVDPTAHFSKLLGLNLPATPQK